MVIFTQTSFLFHRADSFLGTSEDDDDDDDDIRCTISKIKMIHRELCESGF